jgi:hypothetical protein
LRQAYDYWQNQPGNYRAPRTACRPCFRAVEIVTGSGAEACEVARPAPAVCRAGRAPRLLSPPEFPRASSAGEEGSPKRPNAPPKSPKRRPCQEVPRERSPTGRYPRWLRSRAGQRPSTHRAQPSALRRTAAPVIAPPAALAPEGPPLPGRSLRRSVSGGRARPPIPPVQSFAARKETGPTRPGGVPGRSRTASPGAEALASSSAELRQLTPLEPLLRPHVHPGGCPQWLKGQRGEPTAGARGATRPCGRGTEKIDSRPLRTRRPPDSPHPAAPRKPSAPSRALGSSGHGTVVVVACSR